MNPSRQRLFKSSAVVLTVLVALVMVLAVVYFPMWYPRLYIWAESPRLEKHFGFQSAFVEYPGRPGLQMFQLTSVDPAGILGRAGVKSGDFPVGYHHGFATGFLSDLESARRGDMVEFAVVARDQLDVGATAWRLIRLEHATQR